MANAKSVLGTAKKTVARRTTRASAPKAVAVKRAPPKRIAKKASPAPKNSRSRSLPPVAPSAPASISEAQDLVVASKFAGVAAPRGRRVRPTLPESYGESRLLLLARDPKTLFAAWDIAPATIDSLKARLGRRGFAVSPLTLRLTRAGFGTSVIHVGHKARSCYLKIEGGPSFMAEVGYTIPAGRFEQVARSAPCFVPMGPLARPAFPSSGRRAVLGYREARALVRRGAGRVKAGSHVRPEATASVSAAMNATASAGVALASRTLGGASDLYRR
ncbi:MAG: DUF4912 domain-containing protein [Vicinamibacteria bacterium]